jgi:hypothetical protein
MTHRKVAGPEWPFSQSFHHQLIMKQNRKTGAKVQIQGVWLEPRNPFSLLDLN